MARKIKLTNDIMWFAPVGDLKLNKGTELIVIADVSDVLLEYFGEDEVAQQSLLVHVKDYTTPMALGFNEGDYEEVKEEEAN